MNPKTVERMEGQKATEPDGQKAQQRADNKKWYDRHKEDLLKKRRDRYQKDPQFREKVLKDQRKREEQRMSGEFQTAPMMRRPLKRTSADLKMSGKEREVVLLPAKVLATSVNRSVQTIRLWERKGLIPQTPFRRTKKGEKGGKGGHRYYTFEQMETIKKEVASGVDFADKSVCARVERGWKKMGIPVGKLVTLKDETEEQKK